MDSSQVEHWGGMIGEILGRGPSENYSILSHIHVNHYYPLDSFQHCTFLRKIDITPIAFHKTLKINYPFKENGKRVLQ